MTSRLRVAFGCLCAVALGGISGCSSVTPLNYVSATQLDEMKRCPVGKVAICDERNGQACRCIGHTSVSSYFKL